MAHISALAHPGRLGATPHRAVFKLGLWGANPATTPRKPHVAVQPSRAWLGQMVLQATHGTPPAATKSPMGNTRAAPGPRGRRTLGPMAHKAQPWPGGPMGCHFWTTPELIPRGPQGHDQPMKMGTQCP